MWKLFKDAFKYTNDGIILATPLILWSLLITIYLSFAMSFVDTLPETLLAFITLLCIVSAFFAGWFYMTKKSIAISKRSYVMDEDKNRDVLGLMRLFPTGVGKYFLSCMGLFLILGLLFGIFNIFVLKFGFHYIGKFDFNTAQLRDAMISTQNMKVFLDSLDETQLIKLFCWNILFLGSTSIFSFLFMLSFPELIYNTKNPFMAILRSIKKVFIKFPKSLGLYFYIAFVNMVISFIGTFTMRSSIAYILMTIIYFYFMVYLVVLIFSYYDREFNNAQDK